MFDILIKNAVVVDGTGAPRYSADIAVKNGVIADIAPRIEAEAAEVVDAAGKVVTPGFIDYHSHRASTRSKGRGRAVPTAPCGRAA